MNIASANEREFLTHDLHELVVNDCSATSWCVWFTGAATYAHYAALLSFCCRSHTYGEQSKQPST